MTKYNHYGAGFGIGFNHPLLEKYNNTIDSEFSIILLNETPKEEKDIIQTLKLSLKNKKSFYENAPDYMKKRMEEYQKGLEEGDLY